MKFQYVLSEFLIAVPMVLCWKAEKIDGKRCLNQLLK